MILVGGLDKARFCFTVLVSRLDIHSLFVHTGVLPGLFVMFTPYPHLVWVRGFA